LENITNYNYLYFFMVQQPNAGQGRLIAEVFRPPTVTHHSQ
jgi:hypothetical protein